MEIGGGKCDYNITQKKERLMIYLRSLMNKNCFDAKNHIGRRVFQKQYFEERGLFFSSVSCKASCSRDF